MKADQIIEAVQNFAEEDHSSAQMCIVTIMSHGRHGTITGTDGRHAKSENILKKFHNKAVPELKGKPKLFIFAHCRR